VGGGPAIIELGNQVEELLSTEGHKINLEQLPSLDDIYPHLSQKPGIDLGGEPFPAPKPTTGKARTTILMHSSGSTGLPRPVACDQDGLFKNVINQRKRDSLTLQC
jgi:acyl-coenzyme A synthetase/AMP-(fatty) acid ligase